MLVFGFPVSQECFGIPENIPTPSQHHPMGRFLMRWQRATAPGPPSRAGKTTDARGSADQSSNQSDVMSGSHNEDLFSMLRSYMTSRAVIHVRQPYHKRAVLY